MRISAECSRTLVCDEMGMDGIARAMDSSYEAPVNIKANTNHA